MSDEVRQSLPFFTRDMRDLAGMLNGAASAEYLASALLTDSGAREDGAES